MKWITKYIIALFWLILLNNQINCQVISSESGKIEFKSIEDKKQSYQSSKIEITAPNLNSENHYTTNRDAITIYGMILDETDILELLINGNRVVVSPEGRFQHEVSLNQGENQFQIVATKYDLNIISKDIIIERTPAKNEDLPVTANSIEDEINHGNYYALIIGVNEYQNAKLMDLENPINDATDIYITLASSYTFNTENIIFLKNPTRAEIILNLDELSYKLTENDNLLIFYAGHGHWDGVKETGYWLPADANPSNTVNWLRNTTLQSYIDDIPTKHTLLISDACFSGSIFKSRSGFLDASLGINKLYSLNSRKAMTSGTLEEVPDRSVFIEYLLKRLQQNQKKYLSSEQLFSSIREAVLNNSPNVPQYGTIQDTGDEGGDFIFIHK